MDFDNTRDYGRSKYERKKLVHKNSKRSHSGNANTREARVEIYEDTIQYCTTLDLPTIDPIKYAFDEEPFVDDLFLQDKTKIGRPLIHVANQDSFEMAIKIGHPKVMVLNMASDRQAGGGVNSGCAAQEEELFRRSNYHETCGSEFYPLTIYECVYAPLVHIVKDTKYDYLEEPHEVSCLAIAAIRNPKTNGGKYLKKYDLELMQEKIDMIFKVAIYHDHRYLVLGALGCGAFSNPPFEVVELFKNSIKKYGDYFSEIGFAVLCVNENDQMNLEAFSQLEGFVY